MIFTFITFQVYPWVAVVEAELGGFVMGVRASWTGVAEATLRGSGVGQAIAPAAVAERDLGYGVEHGIARAAVTEAELGGSGLGFGNSRCCVGGVAPIDTGGVARAEAGAWGSTCFGSETLSSFKMPNMTSG